MLENYTGRDLSAWHMPGHKRKAVCGGIWDEVFRLDVTEVPGTDDLHHATGAIRESERAAAAAAGAAFAHYLVGGSTAGILASVAAAAHLWRERETGGEEEKDRQPLFLAAENCHRSVWNGLRLAGAAFLPLKPEGDPTYGPVTADELLRILSEEVTDTTQVAGCIVTSPTYGGSLSSLGELHAVLQVYGIPMIVDEAHGAHLPFCEALAWYSGVQCGAEYVIASLHKTLPAMTQTAILYVGGERTEDVTAEDAPDSDGGHPEKGSLRLEAAITGQLAVFQSSSPSYLLMLSAEEAVAWADENRERFDRYISRIQSFREELAQVLNGLELVSLPGTQDPTRLFLRRKRMYLPESGDSCMPDDFPGPSMAAWLERDSGIVAELAGGNELIFISTVCDEEEDLQRLREGLLRLDAEVLKRREAFLPEPEKAEEKNDGTECEVSEGVRLPKAGDFVQRDIYVYPPGVPIVRAGERVTENALQKLREEYAAGRRIYGL